MRTLGWLVTIAVVALASSAQAASFNCAKARSVAEKLICGNAELSHRDDALGRHYANARMRVKRLRIVGAPANAASKWLAKDTARRWRWRERNCRDLRCLRRWYTRRIALLQWLDIGKEPLGWGFKDLSQAANQDVIITLYSGNSFRSVLYYAAHNSYRELPTGIPRFTNSAKTPIAIEEKGYFKPTGAFWYTSLRDRKLRIVDIGDSDGGTCMSKATFIRKTHFTAYALRLVQRKRICVSI